VTILCEPNKATADAVAPRLNSSGATESESGVRVVDNLTDAAAWVGYDVDERLVVIGAAVPFIDVVAFADYMHTIYPDALLVLVRDVADDDVRIEALAAGFTAVVSAGDEAALAEACARARRQLSDRSDDAPAEKDETATEPPATEAAPLGQVVTVFSAKGGTGKTVVSTNLALALHKNAARRVCILDLDLEFGDVAISMKLAPTRGIIDAVELDLQRSESLTSLLTRYAPRLDCVLAPVNPGDAERISPALVAQLISQLRARYDYVVIDTPSQFSEHVLEALDAADHHVLITTPEIPALKNLRLTLDMLDMLGYDRGRRSILLNRADPKVGMTVDDVETAIKTVLTAKLPATQDAPASINRGEPLVAGDARHPFSVALAQFAASAITNSPVTAERRTRRLGIKLRKRSS
jgi:pilus assembly protein CpaE